MSRLLNELVRGHKDENFDAVAAARVLLLQQQIVQDLMARHLRYEIHGRGKADAEEGRTRRFCLSQCGRVLQQE